MLHHLGHPYALLGVVAAVVLGLFGHNIAQARTAQALGDGGPVRDGFGAFALKRQIDPLGAVAYVLVTFGWGFPAAVPIIARFRRQRVRATAALLAGPLFLLLVTFLAVAALRSASGAHLTEFLAFAATSSAGLFIASLIPIPPLTGGRILFLYAPTTAGWQKARYHLLETQTGPLIALAILLLPAVFPGLPDVVSELVNPLLRQLGRAVGLGFVLPT